jgi:hypothetical protein
VNERKTERKKRGGKDKGVARRARREGPTKADIESLLALIELQRRPRHVFHVLPGTQVRLRLSDDERRLILDDLMSCGLPDKQVKALERLKQPGLSMTLADWEDFGGWVASTGNHAREGSKLQRRADALSDRIQWLLDTHAEANVKD